MSNRDEIEFMTTNFSAVNNNLLICRGTCLSDKRNEAVISDNKQLDKAHGWFGNWYLVVGSQPFGLINFFKKNQVSMNTKMNTYLLI
jgi:hypothetical protein